MSWSVSISAAEIFARRSRSWRSGSTACRWRSRIAPRSAGSCRLCSMSRIPCRAPMSWRSARRASTGRCCGRPITTVSPGSRRASRCASRSRRAAADRKSGEIRLARFRQVADPIENEFTQISPADATARKPGLQLGEFLIEELPPIDFGRIAAQTAKQVIVQKVREAERRRQFEEFKDRKGDIVNGLVKRVEFGNVTFDMGRGESILRRDELLPRGTFRTVVPVRALIYDVREEQRGPQIFLSRTRNEFMGKLFAQEVPEIYDGIIEIKSVARDPGSRAKIAVISNDSSIDPVGACVGMRGSRVQAVVERIPGQESQSISLYT